MTRRSLFSIVSKYAASAAVMAVMASNFDNHRLKWAFKFHGNITKAGAWKNMTFVGSMKMWQIYSRDRKSCRVECNFDPGQLPDGWVQVEGPTPQDTTPALTKNNTDAKNWTGKKFSSPYIEARWEDEGRAA